MDTPKPTGDFPTTEGGQASRNAFDAIARKGLSGLESAPNTYRICTDEQGSIQTPQGNPEDKAYKPARTIPGA